MTSPPQQQARLPILRTLETSKHFGGVQALQEVSIELYPGEIPTIMGENGAGKSTLGKVIAGVIPAYSGKIEVDGKEVSIRNPTGAQRLGIAIIFQ